MDSGRRAVRRPLGLRSTAAAELPKVKHADWARTPIDRFILNNVWNRKDCNRTRGESRAVAVPVVAGPHRPAADPDGGGGVSQGSTPNAYEKAVDRLLASPRYGEHMAVPWLDYSRYADSNSCKPTATASNGNGAIG